MVNLEADYNLNFQLKFPETFTAQDRQDILPLLACKRYCPGEVRLFKENFFQQNVVRCTSDADLGAMLLRIVSRPCTQCVCCTFLL